MRIKSVALTVIAGVLLATSAIPAASASAQSSSSSDRKPATTRILCGLRAGSIFNFSSAEDCATGTASASPAPAKPTPATPQTGRYVALGDSVAAGDGLPLAAGAQYPQCRQSTQGYPHLVAAQLDMPLTNVSCSGATVGDMVSAQGVDGPNIPAQLPRAFAGGVPELITMTAGANDVTWNNFIYACYRDDCTKDRYDLAARGLLALYREKLSYVLNDIENRSGSTPPQVIVTGYYNPLSNACTTQTAELTRDEIRWLTRQLNSLNRIIRTEVRERDFATYVPISFGRHDICSRDPWVQGLNDKAPLHPTAEGQAYIAKRIIAATD